MAGAYQQLIEFIRNGELVDAGVTNRPIRQIAGNTDFLKSLIDLVLAGETLIATGRTLAASVEVGQPVFFNASTLQFEKALATAEADTDGNLVTAASAQVWGVVLCKENATKGDILLRGVAEINLDEAIDGAITAGLYYLSGAEAGKLSGSRPPVAVRVLQVSQPGVAANTWEVFVNPQFVDHLEQHKHVKFALQAVPAGDHTPPAVGSPHAITNPDSSIEGWLPASHASFNGLAPTGAKFGYNLAASKLANIWPPIPVENAVLMMYHASVFEQAAGTHYDFSHDFGSISGNAEAEQTFTATGARIGDHVLATPNLAMPPDTVLQAWVSAADEITIRLTNTTGSPVDPAPTLFHIIVFPGSNAVQTRMPHLHEVPQPQFVIIDRNGLWWMTDCYNEVPWPTALDTQNPSSVTTSESCPVAITDVLLELWYTSSLFFSSNFGVLSLVAAENSGIIIRCPGTVDEKSTGHLELDLDLGLNVIDAGLAGHQVIKTLDSGNLQRGPVAESIRSASPELIVTSNFAQTGPNGERYGNIVLTANLDLTGAEFAIDTVHLNGVEEEFYQSIIALNFKAAHTAQFRGRILVPTRVSLPTGTQMKLRFWVMSRAAGSLGAGIFTLSYRRLARPSAILSDLVALPTSDTALAMTSTVTFTDADQYVEMESSAFDIATGDEIQFTMQRTPPDGYADDLFILRKEGVLVAGS